jgi:hypothetical protein
VDLPDGSRRLGRPLRIPLDEAATGLFELKYISKFADKQNTVMYLHQLATFFGSLEHSSSSSSSSSS